MPVLYRMRGLLGDATEDMVNTLDSGNGETYKIICLHELIVFKNCLPLKCNAMFKVHMLIRQNCSI